jgi:hypothetical protein
MIVDQKLNKRFVGMYLIDGCLDGTQMAVTTKPSWFKRTMTRWLIGWKWISIEKLKEKQDALKLQTQKKVVDITTRAVITSK